LGGVGGCGCDLGGRAGSKSCGMLAVWWRPLGGGWLRGGDLLGVGVGDDLRGGLLTLEEGEGGVREKEVLTKVIHFNSSWGVTSVMVGM
jgi:hypothetical protein